MPSRAFFGRHCASGLWKRIKDEWIVTTVVSLDEDERLKWDWKWGKSITTVSDWSVKTFIKTVLKTDEDGWV